MDVSNVRLLIDETGYSGDSDRWIAEVAYDPVARRIAGIRSSSASQVTRCYAHCSAARLAWSYHDSWRCLLDPKGALPARPRAALREKIGIRAWGKIT
jgi:hypothetical protein